MHKIKYRLVLNTLRNIKPDENIKHNTISKVLGGKPSPNALANKYHEDGYLEYEQIKILEKKYQCSFIERASDFKPEYTKNLINIRNILSISIEELSERTGVSAEEINLYESGEKNPPADFYVKLNEKLNINLNWFIAGNGSVFNNKPDYITSAELPFRIEEVLKNKGII